MKRKFIALIVSVLFFNLSCAVTGPTVTRQEEEAARAQLKQADYRVWWSYQKRLFRVSDRFAWGVNTPGFDALLARSWMSWPAGQGFSAPEAARRAVTMRVGHKFREWQMNVR